MALPHIIRFTLLALSAFVAVLGPVAWSQTVELVYSDDAGMYPNARLVEGRDGNFYGTTREGGARGCGTIFRMTPAGEFTSLHYFDEPSGAWPYAGLTQGRDGNFYGTTREGGSRGRGTVFQMTPEGAVTRLYSFDGTHGAYPEGELAEGADGNFYGTTAYGGANNRGTAFKITPSGKLTTLYSFKGAAPSGELLAAEDGNIYGTTRTGGQAGCGTVFNITPQGVVKVVHTFSGTDGAVPDARLAQGSDGHIYGTTREGGAADRGGVFKMSSEGELVLIHSYTTGDLYSSDGLVRGGDDNFWGVRDGIVFKVSASGELTNVASLKYTYRSDYSLPAEVGLTFGRNGHLYGAIFSTEELFKMAPSGEYTALHQFQSRTMTISSAPLVKGADGSLYGTSIYGGENDEGIVFKLTPAGELTLLHSFHRYWGKSPVAGLVQGNDGNFYGTTSEGSTWGGSWFQGDGTVFSITPTGDLTTLHLFSGDDGSNPQGELVQGHDGHFYGTTFLGGESDQGTVFKITSDGALTTLHSFRKTDGVCPAAGLVPGDDGGLYGTTTSGGAWNRGTVFRITPEGELKTLYAFRGADGAYPEARLLRGNDGNFYGTTTKGAGGYGTAFKLTPGGKLTTLHAFKDAPPSGGVVQGGDGNLYGILYGYVESGSTKGAVFRISPAGQFTILHSFIGGGIVEGQFGTPIFGPDHHLYFRTTFPLAIWRMVFTAPSTIAATTGAASGVTSSGATLEGSVSGERKDAVVSFEYGRTTAYGSSITVVPDAVDRSDTTSITAALSGLQAHTTYHYRMRASNIGGVFVGEDGTFTTRNSLPVAAHTKVRATIGEPVVVTLPFALTDADGDAIAVRDITAEEGAPFTLGEVKSDTVTLVPNEPGTGTIYFTVADGFGGMTSGSVTVSIEEKSANPQAELIASKGELVLGAGQVVGLPEGAVWESFGVPCITESGAVAFKAVIRTGKERHTGIILQRATEALPRVVAVVGDSVPGITGAKLASVKDPAAVTTSQGENVVVFLATISGPGTTNNNGKVICHFSERTGLILLGRTGVPQTVVEEDYVKVASFVSVGLAPDGAVWSTATLMHGAGGVSAASNQALLVWSPTSRRAQVALRKGDVLDTESGRRVSAIETLAAAGAAPGHGRWMIPHAIVMRLRFTDGGTGIYTTGSSGNAVTEVVTDGGWIDVVADGDLKLAYWKRFGLPALDAAGGVAFLGQLKFAPYEITSAGPKWLFRFDGVSKESVAHSGTPDPGSTLPMFTGFKDPVSNAQGKVAFIATEREVQTSKKVRTALWLSALEYSGTGEDVFTSRTLKRVARAGDNAPGAGSAVFAGFLSLALPGGADAGPLFVAKLSGHGVNRTNNCGLWSVDAHGVPQMLLRYGSPVPGLEARGSVKNFTVLGAIFGSPGQSRAYNSHREVKCRITFRDGGQALVNLMSP